MKKIYRFSKTIGMIVFLMVSLFISACTSDFDEINTDKNSIGSIGPAELPFLFTKAQDAVSWNGQVEQNLFADQYAQYVANNTTYFPTDRYEINMEWAGSTWTNLYTGIVPQLQTIFENTDPTSAEYALANIWWVYSFHRVTDYWGPIPYFNAGTPGTSVAYDAQEEIYNDFFQRLASAVDILEGNKSEAPFGEFDIIYGGDVDKWIKFANTLRLRLAMRISKVDPSRAKTEGEAAYTAGVMESSPTDDALALNNTLDINPLSQMTDWNEFRMSATMESVLKGYEDPRISEYWIPAVETGTYEGLRNGLSIQDVVEDVNTPAYNSHIGPRWTSPETGGISGYLSTSSNVMGTAEAYFLRAEGAMLNWNMGGTSKELYEEGIRQSMYQWGITDESAIDAYINSASTPIPPADFLNSPAVSDVPVKFDEANADIQLEQLAIQKWIALFPDGMEAWADYRRRPAMSLYPVANSDNPDIPDPTTQWIRRLPFLIKEYQSNTEAVNEAVNLLKVSEDKITTPLWWDVN